MGQSHPKKPNSTQSTHELVHTPQTNQPSALPSSYPRPPPLSPTFYVSPPARPHAITRMSELIDPEEWRMYEEEARRSSEPPLSSNSSPQISRQPQRMIESPSGNLLSISEYRDRQDRKLTVAERKEAIREETRRKIAMQPEGAPGSGRAERQDGGRRKKNKCCALGGFLRTCGCCCCGAERGRGEGRGD